MSIPNNKSDLAKPLKYQQLEKSLDLGPYLDYVEEVFSRPISDNDSVSESDDDSEVEKFGPSGIYSLREEVHEDRSYHYNFAEVGPDRLWLKNLLLSDSEDECSVDSSEISDEDERTARGDQRIKDMLKEHALKQKHRRKFARNPELKKYQYYGSGLLSVCDRYTAHRDATSTEVSKCQLTPTQPSDSSHKKRKIKSEPGVSGMKGSKKIKKEHNGVHGFDEAGGWVDSKGRPMNFHAGSSKHSGKSRRSKNSGPVNIEVLNARRRKIWVHIAKKEINRTLRNRSSSHKEALIVCKRAAQMCMKVCRQKAMQSQKNMKENVWRMKRITREMQAHWKRYDRSERETRRRMEKEAEEQRKMDVEMMEVKRQQRKLNFLITQTELYAHFMQRKLTAGGLSQQDEMLRILGQLDEGEKPARLAAIDDYNSEAMKAKAQHNVNHALNMDQVRVEQFPQPYTENAAIEVTEKQPDMFEGVLKHYQLKGVSWLANLYDQGINGILADEMGLGKTVQSIAFLCHIAEKYSIWGPFLVISPASTLHNWQQEFARFVPQFKVIPYWGNPQERRILRQFWAQKNVHTEEASFHVVITSYQLVVADIKYFNRVKWQYLVLDEAQAIKSSSSVRWKSLLGFQCRNRLLLSGTPVQNSMAELWALLHFIMPTLFDNHEEFAEWFSKDIESHVENKGSIDEKHLSRLHMILKPFMLRRIKKDVENELSDKIELMVYCPLTIRQKLLYSALKKKIRIEDLLYSSSSGTQSSVTSSLMNLVMQFRKVCNHPELFERQEPRVPHHCKPLEYYLPQFLFQNSLLPELNPEVQRFVLKQLGVMSAENIHHNSIGNAPYRTFSFIRLCDLSPGELGAVHERGAPEIWALESRRFQRSPADKSLLIHKFLHTRITKAPDLLFTKQVGCKVNGFGMVRLHSMPETLEHRILRSSKVKPDMLPEPEIVTPASTSPVKGQQKPQVRKFILPEFQHVPRPPVILECHPIELPNFLTDLTVKVDSRARFMYCCNRRAANVLAWTRIMVMKQLFNRESTQQVPWGSRQDPVGMEAARSFRGWSNIFIPDKQSLISDAGKLSILDNLLHRLKSEGHRVLIYSQMTKMIDLLEEFMYYRKHTYMRLDGSSKISERRDMVADFQNREDIFVFLLSTRAGGLGINLTAADTVIFYDSDWNPTVDQQAMDRAHRLGQTKQVTVYRLICKDTIEERILQRAQEKSEIQRMVISGGSFKPDTLKPTEVVSLLLDDAEIERKYRQRQAERRGAEDKRNQQQTQVVVKSEQLAEEDTSMPASPSVVEDDDSDGNLIVDVEGPAPPRVSASKPRSHHGGSSMLLHETSKRILNAVRGLTAHQRGQHGRTRGRPRGMSRRGPPGRNIPASGSGEGSPVESPSTPGSSLLRKGPGRPRLKPFGPSHQGTRGRKRKKVEGQSANGDSPASDSLGVPGTSVQPLSTSSLEVKEREFKSFSFFLD